MAKTPEINPLGFKTWANRHDTFTQTINNYYDIKNGDTGNIVSDYNATTAAVQTLIGQAITEGRTVRALGAGWSFSPIAATDGWLLMRIPQKETNNNLGIPTTLNNNDGSKPLPGAGAGLTDGVVVK